MIGVIIFSSVMALAVAGICYDMFFDRIPSVIYMWDDDLEKKVVVFYTNSYRKAKKVKDQFEKHNPGLAFGITEAWHNPNIRR